MSAEKKSLYSDYEEVPEKPYVVQNSKYLLWMYKLDNLGVEIRGIERVTLDERATNSKWKLFMQVIGLWFAACGGVTTMSSFFFAHFGVLLGHEVVSHSCPYWCKCG